MITTLYVMLISGIAFLIAGTAVSYVAIGQTWARGWPMLTFGGVMVAVGVSMTILPLNWALGL